MRSYGDRLHGVSVHSPARKMMLVPLILLLILGVSGVYGDSHSLRYYRTAVSAPGFGIFFYSSVGYVDDKVITNYNSSTRQCLPMIEWVKKLDPEYWERNTKINQVAEAVYKRRVQVLMSRFNQTGVFFSFCNLPRVPLPGNC